MLVSARPLAPKYICNSHFHSFYVTLKDVIDHKTLVKPYELHKFAWQGHIFCYNLFQRLTQRKKIYTSCARCTYICIQYK